MRIYTRELNYIKSVVYVEGMQLYEDRHLPEIVNTGEFSFEMGLGQMKFAS
jgi:hypothetical protein